MASGSANSIESYFLLSCLDCMSYLSCFMCECRDFQVRLLTSFSTSSLAALALDIITCQKGRKQGVYVLPEDDQNALKMRNGLHKKVVGIHTVLDGWQEERQRSQAPVEAESTAFLEEEQDITYHSRYGLS
jgi:hypothetical protein